MDEIKMRTDNNNCDTHANNTIVISFWSGSD